MNMNDNILILLVVNISLISLTIYTEQQARDSNPSLDVKEIENTSRDLCHFIACEI